MPVLEAGEPLGQARAAMILVHGRGATAQDIMTLVPELVQPGIAFLAPQAAGNAWYPNPFTAPIESNEPFLSSALDVLETLISRVERTIPAQRMIMLGFSQGACLTLEFAARHARRYGGVIGLSGGLIGPPGSLRDHPGQFEGTPVFLGCSDIDPYIQKERVVEAAAELKRLGADVTLRFYPGMGHLVSNEEIEAVRTIVEAI